MRGCESYPSLGWVSFVGIGNEAVCPDLPVKVEEEEELFEGNLEVE